MKKLLIIMSMILNVSIVTNAAVVLVSCGLD